jgi:pyridoxal phosphate enzyme (YggS family)
MERIIDFLKNCPKVNPQGENITLVAATKMVTPETIKQAALLGIEHIGENKAQEFTQKHPFYPPATYHFIGHLQTNKVKQIVGKAHLIQSVDSIKLLTAIEEFAKSTNLTQNILLEVNIANDKSKHGFLKEELFDALTFASGLKNICVQGLMTVLPKCENKNKLTSLCLQLRSLYDIIKEDNPSIEYLSMGMSCDYLTAIECGSNMIRIGSLLFGERDYS